MKHKIHLTLIQLKILKKVWIQGRLMSYEETRFVWVNPLTYIYVILCTPYAVIAIVINRIQCRIMYKRNRKLNTR